MATSFIDHLTEHFKPQEYHDTYIKKLLQVIKDKAKGRRFKAKVSDEPVPTKKSADLMLLLKESLEKAKYQHATIVN